MINLVSLLYVGIDILSIEKKEINENDNGFLDICKLINMGMEKNCYVYLKIWIC